MKAKLAGEFFNRSAVTVAKALLGKFLVRRYRGKEFAYMIIEVEAYDGFNDKGSHAHRGKTRRNKPMFGKAGRWYVYFTYGMHWMLNIVCGKVGYPAAVLIRGVEGISGPARLTRKLKINSRFNGKFTDRKIGLWIGDRGIKIKKSKIKKGPRIGIGYAGQYWAKKPWRFWVKI